MTPPISHQAYIRAMNRITRDNETLHRSEDHTYEKLECDPMRTIDDFRMTHNADDAYFNGLHESQSLEDKMDEEDLINLRDLIRSDNELFCFVNDYLVDNWDEFKKLTVMLLNGADDKELGKELKRLKDLALPEYLSMVRKS